MLEQRIIEKLTPLKNEKLIILADPQPMIRSGAQAVDGWAKVSVWGQGFISHEALTGHFIPPTVRTVPS